MNLFGWLSSGPKAAEQVLDAGIKGLDALVFTDEEKSVARQKLADNWIELQKTLGAETTIRSVTRRMVALVIMVSYTVLILGAALAWPFSTEYAKFLLSLAEGNFGYLVLGVGAFYFGPYMLSYVTGNRGKGK